MGGDALSRRRILALGGALALAGIGAPMIAPAAEGATTTVAVEGVPIRLFRAGCGRPVCLIHGASGNLNDMTFRLAPALRERHEVIAFDRPGLGRSGVPPGGGVSVSTQARLLRGALAAIGVERPIVLGHSYGGAVALAWALDAPESCAGLVLVSSPSQVWEGGLGLANDLLANTLTGPPLALAASRLVSRSFAERSLASVFAPQAPPPGYLAHLDLGLVLQPESLRENARQLVALKEELRPMVPRYPGLAMPVEILHGDADRTVGLRIHSVPLARQVPHARLTIFPGFGHMLHQVATDRVAARVGAVAG